jgi:hypothetical protein
VLKLVQLVIGPQLETDQVSQSFFEKSSLNDMTQSVQKKKIKETIPKDLEDIGIWNNNHYQQHISNTVM